MHPAPLVSFLKTNRFHKPTLLETRELLQPQEEYCVESAGGAELESGSHDENLDLGGEGDEEDEEGGRAEEEEEEEERTNEHDGRTFEEALCNKSVTQ